jgi:hypothetical protein
VPGLFAVRGALPEKQAQQEAEGEQGSGDAHAGRLARRWGGGEGDAGWLVGGARACDGPEAHGGLAEWGGLGVGCWSGVPAGLKLTHPPL